MEPGDHDPSRSRALVPSSPRKRGRSGDIEIEPVSPSTNPTPSPRRQRLDTRLQQKESILTSSTINFTQLSVCDAAMFEACQSDKDVVNSQPARALRNLAAMMPQPAGPAPCTGSGSKSMPSSEGQEIRSLNIEESFPSLAKLRKQNPPRPQSSRGGRSIASSQSQLSLQSLMLPSSLAGSTSRWAVETPPSGSNAFETIDPPGAHTTALERPKAELRPIVARRPFLLAGSSSSASGLSL